MKVLLKRYSLSPLDTDDVLQEAALASLLRMLESEIVDLQHFRRYVYDRTRGIVLDRLTRRREVTGNLDAGQLPAPEDQEASSHLTEVVHELRRRVKQLPDRQRNVIERIATGASTGAIAKELGVEEATVRSLLRFARATLSRDMLEWERQHF